MEAPKSPAASLSSVLSSESTKNLIHSLSMANLDSKGTKGSNGSVAAVNLDTIVTPILPQVAPTEQPLPLPKLAENKKPIKFTVRKVSREDNVTIPSRSLPKARPYAYGNLPENRKKAAERRSGDSTLQKNQEKFDLYVKRLDKIDKEIDFLLNLLPPYNVEIDYATRSKITRAVEKLRMKRDEIEKKKYSLGMSISRMWRDYDDNETWVRSVSNH